MIRSSNSCIVQKILTGPVEIPKPRRQKFKTIQTWEEIRRGVKFRRRKEGGERSWETARFCTVPGKRAQDFPEWKIRAPGTGAGFSEGRGGEEGGGRGVARSPVVKSYKMIR